MQSKAGRPEGHRSVNMVLGAINMPEPNMQQWQGGWRKGQVPKRCRKKDWKEAWVLQLAPSPLCNFISRAERSFPQRSSHSAATHPGPPLRTFSCCIRKRPSVEDQGQEAGALRQGDAQHQRKETQRQIRLPRHSRTPSGAAREKSQPAARPAGQHEKGLGQLRL